MREGIYSLKSIDGNQLRSISYSENTAHSMPYNYDADKTQDTYAYDANQSSSYSSTSLTVVAALYRAKTASATIQNLVPCISKAPTPTTTPKAQAYHYKPSKTGGYSPINTIVRHSSITVSDLDDYRFGFQGQEKDDKIKGDGNSINYKYRMHDPRIGRFFAVDPLAAKYPHNSPYAFSENRVIDAVELEGLEAAKINPCTENLVLIYGGAEGQAIGALRSIESSEHHGKTLKDRNDGGLYNIKTIESEQTQVEMIRGEQLTFTSAVDYKQTVKNFQNSEPLGELILVGHSKGADQLLDLVNAGEISGVGMIITFDISEPFGDAAEVMSSDNTTPIIFNFYQDNFGMGDTQLERGEGNTSIIYNIKVDKATHTSIDNKMHSTVSKVIEAYLQGSSVDDLIKIIESSAYVSESNIQQVSQ